MYNNVIQDRMSHNKEGLNMARCLSNLSFCSLYMDWLPAGQCHVCMALIVMPCSDALCCGVQRLIQSMDNMTLDAFIYPGWGNPPRLIGDLSQSGNTPLGATSFFCFACLCDCAVVSGLAIWGVFMLHSIRLHHYHPRTVCSLHMLEALQPANQTGKNVQTGCCHDRDLESFACKPRQLALSHSSPCSHHTTHHDWLNKQKKPHEKKTRFLGVYLNLYINLYRNGL